MAARVRASEFEPLVISTGQHSEMVSSVLNFFSIHPDLELKVMTTGQTLAGLTSRLMESLDAALESTRPDLVVVQGDTTTAMCGALAAFYRRIPVAHVEAGLRTDRLDAPFPEELNRRVVGQVASWHFAPTERAKAALLRDAVHLLGGRIFVTGNTVIDALLEASRRVQYTPPADPVLQQVEGWLKARPGRRMILVTGHRRENFGERFKEFCLSLRDIAAAHDEVLIVYPVHLNPNVKEPATRLLGGVASILLTEPKSYPVFVRLMMLSALIITDSGGVQEEAPALGKPVLITRETTERPEALEAGVVALVGANRERLVAATTELLDDAAAYTRMAKGLSPYGDGFASARCLDLLAGKPVEEFKPPLAGSRQ